MPQSPTIHHTCPTAQTVLSHLGLAVFGGELLGCLAWGPFADTHGRQRAYLLSCLLMLLASVASAVSPTYAFLLCTRALVGVGIGGLAVPFDLLCEATPPRHRGAMLMLMQGFWVLGSVAVVGLAWGVLPAFPPAIAWRWLAGLAAVPLLVATVATCFLPESPRWLLEQGRGREAWEGLCRAAAWNGKDLTAAVLGSEGGRRRLQEEEGQGGAAVVATEVEGNKQKNAAAAAAAEAPAPPHLLLFHPHHHKLQHQQQEGAGKAAAASGGAGPSVGQQSHGCSALASTFMHLLSPSLRTTTLFLWVMYVCVHSRHCVCPYAPTPHPPSPPPSSTAGSRSASLTTASFFTLPTSSPPRRVPGKDRKGSYAYLTCF